MWRPATGLPSLRMTKPPRVPQFFALAGEGYDGRVIARLKPSMTSGQANAELGAVIRDIARQFPAEYARDATLRVQPLLDDLTGPLRQLIWFLFGAVGFVLAIACANVASLQLARAAARTREFATRSALGGGRMRLVSQLLIESLVLAIAGGAAGVLAGLAGTRAIVSLAPRELPRVDEIQMDGGVLLFTLAITLITGIVFGVAPAWMAARVGVNDMLKRTSGLTGRATGNRLRHALVVVNVALAFALIVATGLLVRSFRNLNAVDPGFNPHHVLTLTPVMSPPATGAMTPAGRLRWYRALIAGVQAIPGVTAVGIVSNVPMSHTEPFPMRLEGATSASDAEASSVDLFWVSSEYCRALEIPLKRGRWLTDRDGVDAPPAVLVSESFARLRFGSADPLGRRIQVGPQRTRTLWSVIVGVVGDVRNDALDRAPREAIYQPHAMNPFHYVRLVARTSGDPVRAERAVRAAIRAADPATAVFHVQPMDDYVASSLAERRFALTLTALFGVVASSWLPLGRWRHVSFSGPAHAGDWRPRSAGGGKEEPVRHDPARRHGTDRDRASARAVHRAGGIATDLRLPIRRRSSRSEHAAHDGRRADRGRRCCVVLAGPRRRPPQSTRRAPSVAVTRSPSPAAGYDARHSGPPRFHSFTESRLLRRPRRLFASWGEASNGDLSSDINRARGH